MTITKPEAEQWARTFHEIYERLAPSFGYETRTDTRDFDPQSKNGRLMVAVCGEVVQQLLDARESQQKAKIADLQQELDWQNHRNSGHATKGGFEFYINEEWTGLANAALDQDAGWQAALRKHRLDPDDERVRIRRVAEDDTIIRELDDLTARNAALVAERDKLASEISGLRSYHKWAEGDLEIKAQTILKLSTERDNLLATVSALKAEVEARKREMSLRPQQRIGEFPAPVPQDPNDPRHPDDR